MVARKVSDYWSVCLYGQLMLSDRVAGVSCERCVAVLSSLPAAAAAQSRQSQPSCPTTPTCFVYRIATAELRKLHTNFIVLFLIINVSFSFILGTKSYESTSILNLVIHRDKTGQQRNTLKSLLNNDCCLASHNALSPSPVLLA